jgi:hypothetical protein
LLLPLLFAAPRAGRGRAFIAALVVPVLTLAPFALWDFRELWRDLILAQMYQPFRMDALSLLALWGRAGGATPRALALVGFAAAGLVLFFTLRRRSTILRSTVAAAAAFLWLVLLNKQAFCNYLWLAASLLAVVCALPGAEAEREPEREAFARGDALPA